MKKSLILIYITAVLAASLLGGCRKSEPADTAKPDKPTETPDNKPAAPALAEKINMSVLYAGNPGSDREKEFVDFLNACFTEVTTGDLAEFDGSQSADADVTILDYDGDLFQAPQPVVPEGYDRPTVGMGVVGAIFSRNHEFATSYL